MAASRPGARAGDHLQLGGPDCDELKLNRIPKASVYKTSVPAGARSRLAAACWVAGSTLRTCSCPLLASRRCGSAAQHHSSLIRILHSAADQSILSPAVATRARLMIGSSCALQGICRVQSHAWAVPSSVAGLIRLLPCCAAGPRLHQRLQPGLVLAGAGPAADCLHPR